MAHLALYRTYRPLDFDSVVGQKHIVRTFRNQIRLDRLSHAYILTGPRGTGKTSIARIVAKAINCLNLIDGSPCNHCESCLSVTHGNHPDVYELDGASNNGVDEIRDIRERVKYAASLSKYKVYIIDEVHMLSTGAFNALLKTLEEPPSHVIFMLATTEIHKVPETILSRTQRFDLKQIPLPDMTNHLTRILYEQQISFEDEVPELVATLANGGLRDALSILDQAIAYQTDELTSKDIHELNGSVGRDSLIELVNAIKKQNYLAIIQLTKQLISDGKLPSRIIDGLLQLSRDILKSQKLKIPDSTGLSEIFSGNELLHLIKKLNILQNDLKIATNAELILEVGLIELAFEMSLPQEQSEVVKTNPPSDENTIIQLQKSIEKLENEVKSLYAKIAINAAPVVVEPVLSVVNSVDEHALSVVVNFENVLIEDVLDHATKDDKNEVSDKIKSLSAFKNLALKEIVMLLKDAEIVAACDSACILAYDFETTALKLLSLEKREKTVSLLSEIMERPYQFISLPKDFWQEQRDSYLSQKKSGLKPALLQFTQTKSKEDVKSDVEIKPSLTVEPAFQEFVEMFGDLVEIED